MVLASVSPPAASESHEALKHHHFESNALPLMLLLIIILLFQTLATTRAQDSTFVSLLNCPDASPNFTTGSQFQSNLLNLLFPALLSNGAINGLFNTSSGFDTDTIYGLVQCRGDVSTEDCKTCLNYATVVIVQRCPNKADATIRFANCMLRYSNVRFFSQMDSQITEPWVWNVNVSDVLLFNQQLGLLMRNLTSLASSKPSKFEQGWIQYTAINKIYGLVQCTEDISSGDCSSCLQAISSRIPTCCGGKYGGWVVSLSCQIWFRQDLQFFRLLAPPSTPSLLQPPPALPSPLPQLPTTTILSPPQVPAAPTVIGPRSPPASDAGGSNHSVVIIVGPTVAGVIVVVCIIILAVYCMRKKKKGRAGTFTNQRLSVHYEATRQQGVPPALYH